MRDRRQHLSSEELRRSVASTARVLARLDNLIRVAQDTESPLLATSVAACMETHAHQLLALAASHRQASAVACDMEAEVRFDLAHVPIADPEDGDLLSGGPLWWEAGQVDARQSWFWSVLDPKDEDGDR